MMAMIQALLLLAACQTVEGADAPIGAGAVAPAATQTNTTTAPDATASPTTAASTLVPTPIDTATPQVINVPVTVEVTRPALGTAERPIQLLFPPLTSAAIISERGQVLADTLAAATGAEFAVGIADSEQAAVQLLCAAPGDVIAFLSAAAYTIAHEQCNAQAGLVAVDSDGMTTQMGMLVTPRPGAPDLAGLAGLRWATAGETSLPNYLYFKALLAREGIAPGETNDEPEDSSALLALLDNTADFTTADFVPPIMPLDRTWTYGEDDPEEWRFLGIPPTRSPIGYVLVAGEPEFGGYRLRDARSRLFDTYPEIYDATRILAVSEPIPNATVALGADFPLALSRQVLATLPAFAASESCQSSLCSADMFGWTGLTPIEDTAYDPIRFIIEELAIEPEALWDLID